MKTEGKRLLKKLNKITNRNIALAIALFVFVKVFFHVLAPEKYSEDNYVREYWDIGFRFTRYLLFAWFSLYVLFNKNKIYDIVTIFSFCLFNIFMMAREFYYLFNIENYKEAIQPMFWLGNYMIAGIYIIMFVTSKISTLNRYGSIHKKCAFIGSTVFNSFCNRFFSGTKASD